ncbi:uncharacterized protein G2W53_006671 [Senna tora]|uniref:Uncharacterized protein n=1 Tax=Senna tora TaxID=362788 RepID=A0A834X5H7_9FABA|nr:uncharacterized protein G2W53_006671 [Senna tora]
MHNAQKHTANFAGLDPELPMDKISWKSQKDFPPDRHPAFGQLYLHLLIHKISSLVLGEEQWKKAQVNIRILINGLATLQVPSRELDTNTEKLPDVVKRPVMVDVCPDKQYAKQFNLYLIKDQTQIIPSSEPEMRRESSSENDMQFRDLL